MWSWRLTRGIVQSNSFLLPSHCRGAGCRGCEPGGSWCDPQAGCCDEELSACGSSRRWSTIEGCGPYEGVKCLWHNALSLSLPLSLTLPLSLCPWERMYPSGSHNTFYLHDFMNYTDVEGSSLLWNNSRLLVTYRYIYLNCFGAASSSWFLLTCW